MQLSHLLPSRVAGGVACLLASLTPVCAETSVSTAPRGVIASTLANGNNAVALPLIAADLFTGVVTANTASTLAFAAGNPSAALTAGGKYYLEVVTGDLEGERFDLNTAASLAAGGSALALDLTDASASTSNSLTAGALNGARCVVRSHVTLGSLKSLVSPGLVGNNSAALADSVQLYVNGAFRLYYLRADGLSWRESGKTVDETARVIAPDSSFVLVLRSGARTWNHAGLVRSNVFRVKLGAGGRAFATGYPVDLSPVQIGAFADANVAANRRWVGNDSAAGADTLQVFDAATGGFVTYSLRGNGVAWQRTGDVADVQNSPFLKATGMVVLTRTNPDADYLILRPFSL